MKTDLLRIFNLQNKKYNTIFIIKLSFFYYIKSKICQM